MAEQRRRELFAVAAALPGVRAEALAEDGLGRVGRVLERVERGVRKELIFDADSFELLGYRDVLVDPEARYAPPNAILGGRLIWRESSCQRCLRAFRRYLARRVHPRGPAARPWLSQDSSSARAISLSWLLSWNAGAPPASSPARNTMPSGLRARANEHARVTVHWQKAKLPRVQAVQGALARRQIGLHDPRAPAGSGLCEGRRPQGRSRLAARRAAGAATASAPGSARAGTSHGGSSSGNAATRCGGSCVAASGRESEA